MGQLTISMAMFNGVLYVYQRVNTMEGSGWFSFVRGWTETWLKHWNHQWIHGSLLRYPFHINYIYIQYITLISYAHFVWLISIHFPASYKNTARTWHDQAGGRLFPCSNAPQADLQLSWRHKIRVQRSSRTNNFISWLFSGLCWGLGDGKSVLSTCKKGVHEKIKFVQVL
jgi:hypothetical protein